VNYPRSGNGTVSGGVTASVANGLAPFTYNWVNLGNPSFSIINGQTATPTFSAFVYACSEETNSFRVDVTDAIGRVSSASVFVSFSAEAAPGQACN
jgi:hypothetical protein